MALAGWLPAAPGWAQSADANRIQVRVLPNPEVYGDTYTLGEIAEMDGFDIKLLKELAAIEIGRSPLAGRGLRLNEGMIRSRLRRAIDDERLELSVPEPAEVRRAAVRVAAEEIEELVLARAAADADADPEQIRQELRGTLSDIVLPKGDLEWQVSPLGRNLTPTGERTYLVVARVNGQDAWRTTVRLKQKVYHEVVMTARPVRRNQIISAEDLKLVRQPLSEAVASELYTSLDQVVGKQARRPAGPNELLTADMVLQPHAVPEGGRVMVVYRTAQVLLAVPAVALVNGRVGDFIPVKNLESGKIVYGVIEDGNTVRVN
jgi:flagella basal body P-ring formation protein FlgA